MARPFALLGQALRLSLEQPLRIERGRLRLSLPVDRTLEGAVVLRTMAVGLEPSGRQIDIGADWTRALAPGAALKIGTMLIRQPGHIAGRSPEAVIFTGLRVGLQRTPGPADTALRQEATQRRTEALGGPLLQYETEMIPRPLPGSAPPIAVAAMRLPSAKLPRTGVEARLVVSASSTEPLALIDLRGDGAVCIGAPGAVAHAGNHAERRALSAASVPEAEGFLFQSRFTGDTCVAVFDRAFAKLRMPGIDELVNLSVVRNSWMPSTMTASH